MAKYLIVRERVIGGLIVASVIGAMEIPPKPTKADEHNERSEGPPSEMPLSPTAITTPMAYGYGNTNSEAFP